MAAQTTSPPWLSSQVSSALRIHRPSQGHIKCLVGLVCRCGELSQSLQVRELSLPEMSWQASHCKPVKYGKSQCSFRHGDQLHWSGAFGGGAMPSAHPGTLSSRLSSHITLRPQLFVGQRHAFPLKLEPRHGALLLLSNWGPVSCPPGRRLQQHTPKNQSHTKHSRNSWEIDFTPNSEAEATARDLLTSQLCF